MHETFDIVLLDAPPVLAATDAVLLSTQATRRCSSCRAGSTQRLRPRGRRRARSPRSARSVIGTVLNGFDVSQAYGYRYKYAYRYGQDYAYGAEDA